MRNVLEVKMSQINKLYYVLIFSFPKQYYTAQLSYVITLVHIKILYNILFVYNNVHVEFNSAVRGWLTVIYFIMKIKSNYIFLNSPNISFLSVIQRSFSQYVKYNWF